MPFRSAFAISVLMIQIPRYTFFFFVNLFKAIEMVLPSDKKTQAQIEYDEAYAKGFAQAQAEKAARLAAATVVEVVAKKTRKPRKPKQMKLDLVDKV